MIDLQNLIDLGTFVSGLLSVGAFAPGFIIAYCRAKLITGRIRSISYAAAEYVIASAIYYAVAAPLFWWIGYFSIPSLFILFFLAPALIGVLLGVDTQKGVSERLFGLAGLKITHAAPTSWDYVFGNLRSGAWVVVTLRNHEQIFGFFGASSFASSDLDRRDLFIQEIRDPSWQPIESDQRARGIWIHESEIAIIELVTDEG